VLLVAAWWLLSTQGVLGNEFVTPPPADVLDRARELADDGTLGDAALVTLERILVAFGLAFGSGVVLGTLLGSVRPVRLALRPLVSFFFPTPKVALYPALLIVLGFGSASKVALGYCEALFPVALATAAGTSQVDARLVWSAAALGMSRRAVPADPHRRARRARRGDRRRVPRRADRGHGWARAPDGRLVPHARHAGDVRGDRRRLVPRLRPRPYVPVHAREAPRLERRGGPSGITEALRRS
jgi:hypothetical protein